MADLSNHGVEPNAKWGFDAKRNTFKLWAARDIDEDEAVLISYGTEGVKPSNTFLMVTYGFALPSNTHADHVILDDGRTFWSPSATDLFDVRRLIKGKVNG